MELIEIFQAVERRLDPDGLVKHVVLIRHALPVDRLARREDEFLDPPLSTIGRRQAREAAGKLSSGRIRRSSAFSRVWSSSSKRARETAFALAEDLRLTTEVEPGLEEVLFDRAMFDRLNASDSGLDLLKESLREFQRSGRWSALPVFENSDSLRRRAVDTISRIATRSNFGETVIVVTHGAFMNALVAEIVGSPDDYFLDFGYCAMVTIRADVSSMRLVTLDDGWNKRPPV